MPKTHAVPLPCTIDRQRAAEHGLTRVDLTAEFIETRSLFGRTYSVGITGTVEYDAAADRARYEHENEFRRGYTTPSLLVAISLGGDLPEYEEIELEKLPKGKRTVVTDVVCMSRLPFAPKNLSAENVSVTVTAYDALAFGEPWDEHPENLTELEVSFDETTVPEGIRFELGELKAVTGGSFDDGVWVTGSIRATFEDAKLLEPLARQEHGVYMVEMPRLAAELIDESGKVVEHNTAEFYFTCDYTSPDDLPGRPATAFFVLDLGEGDEVIEDAKEVRLSLETVD